MVSEGTGLNRALLTRSSIIAFRRLDALWLVPMVPASVLGVWSIWPLADWKLGVISLALLATLLSVSRTDGRHMLIPDGLVLLIAAIGVLSILAFNPDLLWRRLLEAATSVIALLLLRQAYYWVRAREGFGMGDVKFIAAGSIVVGLEGLPSLILIAACSGLALSLFLLLVRGRLLRLPFGPHLAAALWLVWCLGPIGFNF